MKFERVFQYGQKALRKNNRLIVKGLTILCKIMYHCDIPFETSINKTAYFCHNAFGVVINPNAVIYGGSFTTWCNNRRIGCWT